MLYTRYNKNGTMMKVSRDGLAAVEKAGFTFMENPVENPEVVKKATPKKRPRKTKAVPAEVAKPVEPVEEPVEPVVQEEPNKDIVL